MPKYNQADSNRNDYIDSVSRGDIVGARAVVIEGHNIALDTADGDADLWGCVGNLSYLSVAETINVVSTDADDTSAGTGARSVVILGLDASFNAISDVVILDGLTPVESNLAFYRITGLFLLSAGTSLTNEGTINFTASISATIQGCIDPGYSTGVQGFFTLAVGTKGIIKQVELDSTRVGGGQNPDVNFRIYVRAPGANSPWFVVLERKLDTSVQDQLIIPFPLSNRFIEGADLRFTASTTVNATEARARVTMMIWDS